MDEIISALKPWIALVSAGGFLYWLNKQLKAMQGAIEAQDATIKAQAEALGIRLNRRNGRHYNERNVESC